MAPTAGWHDRRVSADGQPGELAQGARRGEVATTPLIIGVAGGSGSGKTTVVRRIADALGPSEVSVLEHDRYYHPRPDVSRPARATPNYDHPDALETPLLVRHLTALRAGEPIDAPVYDFVAHDRVPRVEVIAPRTAIIVEGILIFADADLRRLMDVKVYVDTDADIRFIRRLERDVNERGRTVESVVAQHLATVRPMHLEFVEPSKRYADVIIPEGGYNQIGVEMLLTLIRGLASSRSA